MRISSVLIAAGSREPLMADLQEAERLLEQLRAKLADTKLGAGGVRGHTAAARRERTGKLEAAQKTAGELFDALGSAAETQLHGEQGEQSRAAIRPYAKQWAALTDQQRGYASQLGWSQRLWPNDSVRARQACFSPMETPWKRLRADDRKAAEELGFYQGLWDHKDKETGRPDGQEPVPKKDEPFRVGKLCFPPEDSSIVSPIGREVPYLVVPAEADPSDTVDMLRHIFEFKERPGLLVRTNSGEIGPTAAEMESPPPSPGASPGRLRRRSSFRVGAPGTRCPPAHAQLIDLPDDLPLSCPPPVAILEPTAACATQGQRRGGGKLRRGSEDVHCLLTALTCLAQAQTESAISPR